MLNLKKAQVSIFIVIGVILILATTFLIFNNQFEVFQSSDTRIKNQISDVVKDCLVQYGDNGAFLLGFQGGRINLTPEILLDPRRSVDFGFKIPNWDSEFGEVPTITSMETELENFIKSDGYSCIVDNIDSLETAYDINIAGEFEVDVDINEENIGIGANLPINFNERNSPEVLSIESFYVNIDSLRLGDMYTLAEQVFTLSSQNDFIEELVLDQIYSSSDYSSPDSMPSEGMFYSCFGRVWTIPQLKENLANLNNNNFKYLYFEGTYPIDDIFESNLDGVNAPISYRDYYESHYVFDLFDARASYQNYRVEVMMPSTEVTGEEGIFTSYPYREFEVTPSEGQIVKAKTLEVGDVKIPIPCIQIYHHLYTLDYDLIVRVTDYSVDGDRYIFQFPIRVLIDRNEPKSSSVIPVDIEEPTATNTAYCADESKQYPLSIFVKDKDENYLSDVNISYECINLKCDIGQTSRPTFLGITRDYATPYLDANFPFCINGKIVAEKEGYHKATLLTDTDSSLLGRDVPAYRDLEMIELKKFEIDLSSFLVVDKDTNRGSRIRNESDGYIYATFENEGLDFEKSIVWPNDGEFLSDLELLDDSSVVYNVTVFYADENFDLRGLLEYENKALEVNSGNEIQFTIPASSSEIDADNYAEFYDYVKLAQDSGEYGIKFIN